MIRAYISGAARAHRDIISIIGMRRMNIDLFSLKLLLYHAVPVERFMTRGFKYFIPAVEKITRKNPFSTPITDFDIIAFT